MGVLHRGRPHAGLHPAQGLQRQPFVGAEDAQSAHQPVDVLAQRASFRDTSQQADLFADSPEHQRQRFAFGAQAIDHADGAGNVAGQHGVAQAEDVVAGDVQHGALNVFGRPLALGVEQAELLDFLVRGQQVAFDLVGHPLQGGAVGTLVLARQPHAYPRGQPATFNIGDVDHHAGAGKRLDPTAFAGGFVQPW
ncbi:hypothetical protein D3C71_1543740 [compost metagenome]